MDFSQCVGSAGGLFVCVGGGTGGLFVCVCGTGGLFVCVCVVVGTLVVSGSAPHGHIGKGVLSHGCGRAVAPRVQCVLHEARTFPLCGGFPLRYRGRVDACHPDGTYRVKYDDGDVDDNLASRCVRPWEDPAAASSLLAAVADAGM